MEFPPPPPPPNKSDGDARRKKKKTKTTKQKHINKNISFSFEVVNEYFKLKQQTDSCRRGTLRREARRSRPNGFFINLIDLEQIKSLLPRNNFFQVNFTGLEETVDSS